MDAVQIDWVGQLQQGGWVVVVQAFLVVALIAITFERFLFLKVKRFAPRDFVASVIAKADRKDWGGIDAQCARADHTMARIVRFILEYGSEAPGMVESYREIAQREIDAEYEKLASFSLIASAAPLLGLLGTMIGMIESFQLVAIYGDEGGAAMLAGSIAKALITTAVGLIIALPALFLHHLFTRRVQGIAKSLEEDLERIHRRWFLPGPDIETRGKPVAANKEG